jgi:hypothetical protein
MKKDDDHDLVLSLSGHRRSLPIAAAVLFAVCFMTSPAANAACGDYVVQGTNSKAMNPSSGHSTQMPDAEHHFRLHPEQGSGPCRGPHCRQGAPVPTIPLTLVSFSIEQWGCILTECFAVAGKSDRNRWAECPRAPTHLALSIFHPPR